MSLKKVRHPVRTLSLEQYTVMNANKVFGFHLELLITQQRESLVHRLPERMERTKALSVFEDSVTESYYILG